MELKPEITERIKLLEEKYNTMGQDLASYLDGLLYADFLTYWDYIHLDTLLSLQSPKTSIPDEEIFIMYHQVTELYFKLCLHEYKQITTQSKPEASFLLERVNRINRYFEALTNSFSIMVDGMDQKQFLKFRMSLLPASGFQSAQYRKIEIFSTDFVHLVDKEVRAKYLAMTEEERSQEKTLEEMYHCIYWQYGATELATGKKTLTLKMFEEKYGAELLKLVKNCKHANIWYCYKQLPETDQKNEKLIEALRMLDVHVNVNWPLSHYKSAVRYLHKNPADVAATGGTNWQKYLPPRFQKRIFYPGLWSQTEMEEWGKNWVHSVVPGMSAQKE